MGELQGALPDSVRLIPATSAHLRSKIAIVMRNREYMAAREAILDCASNDSSRIALTRITEADPDPDMLTTLACAVIISGSPSRKDNRNLVAAAVGKTWKALEEMPQRVENIAREVEKVNAHPILAPAGQADRQTQSVKNALSRLGELPGSMRLWAKALRERTQAIRRDYAVIINRGKPPLYWLQFFVKGATGKPNDREVADLLNAAAIALGEEPTFDALSLAQARSRRKYKI
jgi:hypothetical protein